MMEWFKNLNVIVKSGIGIVVVFFMVCTGIYFTVSSELPSPITNDQWVTIIATFFAGTLGGLIALGGIWWQLNHEKEEKVKKLNSYINYIIEKNIGVTTLEKLMYAEGTINYCSVVFDFRDISSNLLHEFETNYINKNIENILGLFDGIKALDLSQKILNYNKQMTLQLNELEKKNQIKLSFESLRELAGNASTSMPKGVVAKKLYFIYYFICEITRFTSTISFALSIDKTKLNILYDSLKYSELKVLKEKFTDLFKEIESLNQTSLTRLEALKIVTTLNKLFLNKITMELYSLQKIIESDELKELKVPYFNLIESLNKDQRINGLALKIYNDLNDLAYDRKIM